MQTTQLAQCKISNADRLTIELVEPPGMPPVIRLRWPDKPSVCTPDAYANTAAAAMQILSAGRHRTRRVAALEEVVLGDFRLAHDLHPLWPRSCGGYSTHELGMA